MEKFTAYPYVSTEYSDIPLTWKPASKTVEQERRAVIIGLISDMDTEELTKVWAFILRTLMKRNIKT